MAHEPLRTEFMRSRPPWHGFFTEGEYNGRIDWWTDYKYRDPMASTGRWRLMCPRYESEDELFWNAPVKNGESVIGYGGNDTSIQHFHPGFLMDQSHGHGVPSLKDWQDNIYNTSTQIKDINAKYKISPEHPGMVFLPSLIGYASLKDHLGSAIQTRLHRNENDYHFPAPLRQYGPRFFSSPINEDCHIKALAGAKYATIFAFVQAGVLVTKLDGHAFRHPTTIRAFGQRFMKCLPAPMLIGVTGATTLCFAAMLRHRDDWKNPAYASAAVAAVMGVKTSSYRTAVQFFFPLLILGVIWQAGRTISTGFVGPEMKRGFQANPLMYTIERHEHAVSGPSAALVTERRKWWN